MTEDSKEIWIKEGYEVFATYGQNGLKIEPLAKKVGKSKSSFYHHFADLEVFTELLLDYHLRQSKIIAQKEAVAKTISPELINILIEHKIDLLFNRQLRFNQSKIIYQKTLSKSSQIIGNEFVRIWQHDLQINLNRQQLEGLYELAIENFFLQVNNNNINTIWLTEYFRNLKRIASNFR